MVSDFKTKSLFLSHPAGSLQETEDFVWRLSMQRASIVTIYT